MRRLARLLFLAGMAVSFTGTAFAGACNVAICTEQGGARMTVGSGGSLDVESGGEIDVESGGALKIAGTDKTSILAAAVAAPVAGVAASYKVARGETALDGSNPTTVATGLTSIVACVASLKGTSAPGVGTSIVTYDWSAANLSLYGWKVTSSSDTTLIASTGTETVGWVCVGT